MKLWLMVLKSIPNYTMKKKPESKKGLIAERKPAPGNNVPIVILDYAVIDDLLKIACTGEEIASILDIDYDTLNSHCIKDKGIPISDYIKKGINKSCRRSLRRVQLRVALGGKDKDTGQIFQPSVPMLIWLGKQHLDQKDKNETDVTSGGKEIKTIPQIIIIESNEKKIVK